MNILAEQIKRNLAHYESVDLPTILKTIYYLHEKRKDVTGNIERYTMELENRLKELDFAMADPVLCCVNAICAEYDYAAFTDGFQAGAALILALLDSGD